MRRLVILMRRSVVLAALVALVMALAVPAQAGRRPDFVVPLSGANEVGGGDPDGSGVARLDFSSSGEVCFDIRVFAVDDVILAHIHSGVAGVNGPVVVDFDFPTNGFDGCVTADPNVLRDIRRNPAAYYVNVHSVEFPGGAVRGQLG
jgi:CHRD domain